MATLLDKRCNCFANYAPAEPVCIGDSANGPCPLLEDCKKAKEVSIKLYGPVADGARDYSDMSEPERQKVEDMIAKPAAAPAKSRPVAEKPVKSEKPVKVETVVPAPSDALDALEADLEREMSAAAAPAAAPAPAAASAPAVTEKRRPGRPGRKPKAQAEPAAVATPAAEEVASPAEPIKPEEKPEIAPAASEMSVEFSSISDSSSAALGRIADALNRIADALAPAMVDRSAKAAEPVKRVRKAGRPSGKRGRPKSK